MNGLSFKYLLIGVVMLAAAGLAVALKPTQKVADQGPKIDLETMIPKQFGDWRMIDEPDRLMVSPEMREKLNNIYNQTLSRTYLNNKGEHVMLSVAYGSNQTDTMQVHKPEVCYPAQGFQILQNHKSALTLAGIQIPVVRLVAQQASRVEPITYWIVLGNKSVVSGLNRKLVQLRYGLTGKVPDGMLVRISNISSVNIEGSYKTQFEFISELYNSVDLSVRKRLFGLNDMGDGS